MQKKWNEEYIETIHNTENQYIITENTVNILSKMKFYECLIKYNRKQDPPFIVTIKLKLRR